MLADLSADLLPMDFEMQPYDPSQTPFSDNATTMTADPADLFAHTTDPHDPNSAAGGGGNGGNGNGLAAGPVGAGPLPTGFGVQPAPNAGSTLTEFTKRRNWSQRVLDELKDFLFILTADGRFLYASPSCKALTGYDPAELIGRIIVELIHPDDASIFVREFHESIASGNPLRFFYRFRKADSKYAIFESHGHPHLASDAASFGANNGASFCRGFFMMARPYPTKNAALLDSFLEHKIENERLRKRVAELKQEEKDENDASQLHWQKRAENNQSVTGTTESGPVRLDRTSTSGTSAAFITSAAPSSAGADYSSMPPPAKPGISNTALTRQNLNEALAASKPDSINDKMARYEGATHIETIEMLTGLRYRDGERSKGISTGERSPALIRGDAGIAILVDKDGRPTTGTRAYSSTLDGSADKKKKPKVADEYVCTDCGTLDSPEWRKGPNGPKTLCNACGLRWAKKEKKRHGGSSVTGSADNTASSAGKPAPSSSGTPGYPPSQGTQHTSPMGAAGSAMGGGPGQSHSNMAI